ncbi:MAG: hypothetical protein OXR73_12725 [Myxococcales bacterium]|nr:hypothetical protein [Myxococcales bacterium]
MARIKGAAIRARLDYLVAHYGPKAQARVLEALKPEYRASVDNGILVSGWYPLGLSDSLLEAAEHLLGEGDGAICREIGRTSARKGLTSTYSVFAERLTAEQIADKMERTTSLVWRSYYDEGVFHTRARGETSVESELTELELQAPWLCHIVGGYIAGHVEVLGGQSVLVEHTSCTLRGRQQCIWEAHWR